MKKGFCLLTEHLRGRGLRPNAKELEEFEASRGEKCGEQETLGNQSSESPRQRNGPKACQVCKGAGTKSCFQCDSSGRVVAYGMLISCFSTLFLKLHPADGKNKKTTKPCGRCGGKGAEKCHSCKGKGIK